MRRKGGKRDNCDRRRLFVTHTLVCDGRDVDDSTNDEKDVKDEPFHLVGTLSTNKKSFWKLVDLFQDDIPHSLSFLAFPLPNHDSFSVASALIGLRNLQYSYAVCVEETPVGVVACHHEYGDGHGVYRLCYFIHSNWTGKGIATAAAMLVCKHMQNSVVNCRRIVVHVSKTNIPSLRVAIKLTEAFSCFVIVKEE